MTFSFKSPLKLAALALALTLPFAGAPAMAQSNNRGGGDPGEARIANCTPGNITCYATQDSVCRSSGAFLALRMSSASAVTLECMPDRQTLDRVFAEANAVQNTNCTAGRLCIVQGNRTGDSDNVYRHMVAMMNACLGSHGLLEVHGILPDEGNRSTLYAGCVRR